MTWQECVAQVLRAVAAAAHRVSADTHSVDDDVAGARVAQVLRAVTAAAHRVRHRGEDARRGLPHAARPGEGGLSNGYPEVEASRAVRTASWRGMPHAARPGE